MKVSYDEILGRLASGEIAMIYGATEILTSIEESYPDAEFSIFNPPVGYDKNDVLAYLPTAMGIAVNKDTENLEAIKEVSYGVLLNMEIFTLRHDQDFQILKVSMEMKKR